MLNIKFKVYGRIIEYIYNKIYIMKYILNKKYIYNIIKYICQNVKYIYNRKSSYKNKFIAKYIFGKIYI